MDALVWALTEIMLKKNPPFGARSVQG
jgi:hypothetical protein